MHNRCFWCGLWLTSPYALSSLCGALECFQALTRHLMGEEFDVNA